MLSDGVTMWPWYATCDWRK